LRLVGPAAKEKATKEEIASKTAVVLAINSICEINYEHVKINVIILINVDRVINVINASDWSYNVLRL